MNDKITKLEKDIILIKERNNRVEANKAWETSFFRTVTICIMTYIVMCLLMYVIGVKDFFINALIPTTGFFLSTVSLPFIKKWWVKRYYQS